MGLSDETDLIHVNTRLAGTRHRPRSSRRRVPAAAARHTVDRTPPNTVQCLGYFPRGWIAPIMSTEVHRDADVRPLFDRERMPAPVRGRLRNVRMFGANILSLGDSIWSIPMSSLERRLAAVTSRTADLIAQLIELNKLRDRLRKAQLAWRSRRIERRQKPRH